MHFSSADAMHMLLANMCSGSDVLIASVPFRLATKVRSFRLAGLVAELKMQIPDVDNIFQIHRRIGEGTFSTVFLTSLRCQQDVPAKQRRFFALKYLVPTSHPKRVAQELRCLKEIG